MPQFVVISDLHAHPWSAFAKGDGEANSRLLRSLSVLDASLAKARELNCAWLFAGDIVHTAGYAYNVVLNGITKVLAQYDDVYKYAVFGNHDARGIGGKILPEQTVWPSIQRAVSHLYLLEPGLSGPFIHQGISIAGAGYQPHADLLSYAEPSDIGIYHQTIRGSRTAQGFALEEGVDPKELRNRHRVAIVGHVHHPQQIDAPDGQAILIPGSPEHHNFGDEGTHGWWILTLDPDPTVNPSVEFIPGGSPEFRTVKSPKEATDPAHFYRIRDMSAAAGPLPDNVTVIAPEPTAIKQRDILQGASEIEAVLGIWLKTAPPAKGIGTAQYLSAGRELIAAQDPIRLRPVRVKSIRLINFCSYEDTTLEARDGIFLVTGEGNDFPSNGAGKTTLIGEALCWALFGTTTKGLGADEVIRWGETDCNVIVHFEDETTGAQLNINRWKSTRSGASGSLAVVEQIGDEGVAWEAESVTAMTAKLCRHLGLTKEIFQNLGYFSQEKLLLFSSATDGERKNVLAELAGLAAYQQASSAADAKATASERAAERAEAEQQTWTQALAIDEQRIEEVRGKRDDWEVAQAGKLALLRAELDGYTLRTETYLAHKQEQLDRTRGRLDTLVNRAFLRRSLHREAQVRDDLLQLQDGQRARIDGEEQEKQRLETALITQYGDLDRARSTLTWADGFREEQLAGAARAQELRQEISQASANRSSATGESRSLTQQRKTLIAEQAEAERKLSAGECPACGQAISAEHRDAHIRDFAARIADLDQRLTILDASANQAEAVVSELEARLRTVHEQQTKLVQSLQIIEGTRDQLVKIDQLTSSIQALRDQLTGLEARAAERVDRAIAASVDAYRQRLTKRIQRGASFFAAREAGLKGQIALYTQRLTQAEAETNPHIYAVTVWEEKVVKIRASIEETKQASLRARADAEMYDYWRKGFSKQGIQSLLIEEVATLFNAQRGNIFPVLTQGVYDVQFSTVSRTKSGDLREKTEFTIFHRGKPVPYASLSGGQRRRVDIGIMLVLSIAVAEWMGSRGILGLLILDEVFGFLDDSGAEGLLDALRIVQERIPTIYAVTHDSHLQSLFPEVIRVRQDARGVSSLIH